MIYLNERTVFINVHVTADVPVWQPAPVQPGRHRHLFQRMQVPPWAQGGEHMAEIHNQDGFISWTTWHIISIFRKSQVSEDMILVFLINKKTDTNEICVALLSCSFVIPRFMLKCVTFYFPLPVFVFFFWPPFSFSPVFPLGTSTRKSVFPCFSSVPWSLFFASCFTCVCCPWYTGFVLCLFTTFGVPQSQIYKQGQEKRKPCPALWCFLL